MYLQHSQLKKHIYDLERNAIASTGNDAAIKRDRQTMSFKHDIMDAFEKIQKISKTNK